MITRPVAHSTSERLVLGHPGRKEATVILVIDDEPGITELLADILEYHGHPVMVAHDAREALAFIARVREAGPMMLSRG